MESQNEPTLVKMRRSGLSLDFAVQNRNLTGISMDYQEPSKSRDVAEYVSMVNGVLSRKPKSGYLPPILEGIATLTANRNDSKKNPTLVNVKAAGLKLDLVLRERRITGLSVDYQQVSGDKDIKAVLRVLDQICSGRKPMNIGAFKSLAGSHSVPVREDDFEGPEEFDPSAGPNHFDKMVVDSVVASLDMLGAGKQALLGLLESRYGMRLQDVPQHPRGFMGILKEILGPTAGVVEKEIVSQIRRNTPVEGSTLEEAVRSLRNPNPSATSTVDTPIKITYDITTPVQTEPSPPSTIEASAGMPSVEGGEAPEPAVVEVGADESTALADIPVVSINMNVPAKNYPESIAMETAQVIVSKPSTKRSWFKR